MMWPGIVETKWRWDRPQHVVKWDLFKNKLKRREDIDWEGLKGTTNEFGMKLEINGPIKGEDMKRIIHASSK